MRVKIDTRGRVVLPRAARDELGLTPGTQLRVSVRDGAIVIEPVPVEMRLARTGQGLAAVPETELPPLTDDVVRHALDGVRR